MEKERWKESSRRLGWSAALLVLALVVIAAVSKTSTRLSTGVEVHIKTLPDGNTLLNKKEVLNLIDKVYGYNLDGRPLGQIDPKRIERMLEREPFVRDADVYLDGRGRVNVVVRQREPVLRIIDGNNQQYYLDHSGVRMPLSPHYAAHVLVATGNIPPYDPDFLERRRYLLKDVFLLAQMLREDPFMHALVEQVYVSNLGELTLIPKLGDQKIYFGKLADAAQKIDKLKIFYKEGIPYEGWRKYKSIDLRYAGQIVCKKR